MILIIVTALGYFVDIYDLLLFSIVRIPSLRGIGVPDSELMSTGVYLMNIQMAGLLVGGLLWGVVGDKKGRLSVLFGSILMYSVANLLNALVTTVPQYAILRFVAGIGLAGELGAAVTMISEALSKKNRGIGTAFVASTGIMGAVAAGFVAERYTWQQAYTIGGVMGLMLLFARVSVFESTLFEALKKRTEIQRGNFLWLFKKRARALKYLRCIALGVPIWFVVGVLLTFSPEIAKELGIPGVTPGRPIMYCYGGAVMGDFLAGVTSQLLGKRKTAIALFLTMTTVGFIAFVNFQGRSFEEFCWLAGYMGFSSGYWAVLLTTTAEQFGTNIRSTVSSTVPNFIRATVIPLSSLFVYFGRQFGLINTAIVLSAFTVTLAYVSLWFTKETFERDLDFVEN